MQKLFLSYRRSDLGHFALWLADRLAAEFGARSVFIDRADMAAGRDFNENLRDAVLQSDVVAPLVGPTWLTVQDKFGRRRLDLPIDVVHQEIATALNAGKTVLPIILGRESVPPLEALPDTIRDAFVRHAIILENAALPDDVNRVVLALERLGFLKISTPMILPDPRKKPEPLTSDEIAAALQELPGWTISTALRKESQDLSEALYRRFIFSGFRPAMRYMAACVELIHERQHHPRWQNTWKTVDVWLTTFDIGQRISSYDVELARAMQAVYAAGEWRRPPAK